MATKKQLAALAKGREKLAKSRKLNGLKDLFKSKSEKSPVKKQATPKAKKTTAQAKKAVRKELSETKKKVRKATTKIFNDAKKKANKTTKKALDATKKTLAKKGLAGAKSKKEYTIYLGFPKDLSDINTANIQKEFKQNGFNVSKTAIVHNFNAWKKDYKSGYRDEKNNYFLFTACGCNPLRFTAERLNENSIGYQKTYLAGFHKTFCK
ncbi:MAG: hypothetical protein K5860_04095 [Bacteroidales bacterium]|nr:hypothetical protein [Bacteroidales bacterium]